MHNVGPITLLKNLEAIALRLYEVVRRQDHSFLTLQFEYPYKPHLRLLRQDGACRDILLHDDCNKASRRDSADEFEQLPQISYEVPLRGPLVPFPYTQTAPKTLESDCGRAQLCTCRLLAMV